MPDRSQATQGKLQDFYQELEQLLRKKLEQDPHLDDVRLKLLELYYETHRRDEFVKLAGSFHRMLKKPAESRDWRRIASMGRMLAPGESLFSGHDTDQIEFVGTPQTAPPAETVRFRRFGDEEQHRPLFAELAQCYAPLRGDPKFLAEFELMLIGLPTRRPTPLSHVRRLSEQLRGAQVYLKRDDLAGDNPHLTAAVIGQACVALRLGRKTLVAGTTDGRRGVVAAQIATRLGLKALVFMDPEQAQRNTASTLFMKLMGADLQLVKTTRYRNRDVREAALEYWSKSPQDCFLITGLDAAPPPYPLMTQDFTSAMGRECRRQATASGKPLPALVVTRGSTASDALGMFPAFFADRGTRLVCVEPEKEKEPEPSRAADVFNQTGMPLTATEKKVAKNILGGLEYPSVAREHALLRASGRVEYVGTPRKAARQALIDLARLEGLVSPIETAHALAFAFSAARDLPRDHSVIVMMAEQADKDVWDIERLLGEA